MGSTFGFCRVQGIGLQHAPSRFLFTPILLASLLAFGSALPASAAPALGAVPAAAEQLGEEPGAGGIVAAVDKGLAVTLPPVPAATNIQLIDKPDDDGTALLMLFDLAGTESTYVIAEVMANGEWRPADLLPTAIAEVPTVATFRNYFGWEPENPDTYVVEVNKYLPAQAPATAGEEAALSLPEPVMFEPGKSYAVRLRVIEGDPKAVFAFKNYDAGSVAPIEQLFDKNKSHNLILAVLFACVILGSIAAARKNPNLFIRRIAGLEAVDEAVGRATEMGKPVFHINGLDSLTVLSTLAGVNILGRIARITANYDTDLVVPAFDPVVLTVSQEVVRNAYLESGRPDAYKPDNIFFLTDQQFSYTASVCGMLVRDKPAAVFLLGSFYAESLMLAETGASIGAIQIAGTDQQAQLPFFITACDYTLIGEELYAASAYLSREPMLLGSLKGQDAGKAFLLVVILVGSLLATFGIEFLTRWFTPV